MARIGVDLDDVLFPWYIKAHRASRTAGITNGMMHLPKSWYPYKEYGCTQQQWLAALAETTGDDCPLYSGRPYPYSVHPLRRLAEAGHSVHIVTARGYLSHGANVRSRTARWLDEHRVPHDTLTFSKDKTVVRTDYFIDDNEGNVRALLDVGTRAVLMDRTWNQTATDLERVQTVSEFARIILEEA